MIALLYYLVALTGFATALCAPVTGCSIKWGTETVTGTASATGVCRYTVKYGSAARWATATSPASQTGVSATAIPPSCPQISSVLLATTTSEDCLYMTIYAPTSASSLPVFAFFPGGSNIMGGIASPGIDASAIAKAGNMVVAVIQTRLGVLGYLPPAVASTSSDPNMGVTDAVLALSTIQSKISAVGGSATKVTIGGQSSGASMVRALMGTPAAKGLFRQMILQSDPLNYGLQSLKIMSTLQSTYYAQSAFAGCSDLACFQKVSAADIITAQTNLGNVVIDPSNGIPWAPFLRPSYGAATIPNEPTNSLYYNTGALAISPSSVPLLITNVKDEAATSVSQIFGSKIGAASNAVYYSALNSLIGGTRANQIVYSASLTDYQVPTTGSGDQFRETLSHLVTDFVWRCPARTLAGKYAAAGGKVYVGEFRQGVTYPLNSGVDLCVGKVCHMDDVYPTFDTSPSPSANTTTFENGIIAAWAKFIAGSAPSSTWSAFSSGSGVSGTGVKSLGGDGLVGSCPTEYWGSKVEWDFQMF